MAIQNINLNVFVRLNTNRFSQTDVLGAYNSLKSSSAVFQDLLYSIQSNYSRVMIVDDPSPAYGFNPFEISKASAVSVQGDVAYIYISPTRVSLSLSLIHI